MDTFLLFIENIEDNENILLYYISGLRCDQETMSSFASCSYQQEYFAYFPDAHDNIDI